MGLTLDTRGNCCGAPIAAQPALAYDFRKRTLNPIRGAAALQFTRASAGTYRGADGLIHTAGINQPRFEHDENGACLGFLSEGARTNLARHSANFSNPAWSYAPTLVDVQFVESIVSGGVAVAASGDGATGSLAFSQAAAGTFSGGADHVYSVIIEGVSGNVETDINLRDRTAAVNRLIVNFDWGTGVASVQSGTGEAGARKLADVGPNGGPVYLLWGVAYAGPIVGGNQPDLFVYPSGTSAGNGRIVTHAAQLEVGRFPSSLIVTQAAAVTRAADSCIVPVANIAGYNASAGTLFSSSVAGPVAPGLSVFASLHDQSFANYVYSGRKAGSNKGSLGAFALSVSQADFQTAADYTPAQQVRQAIAYAAGDYAGAFNGGELQTSAGSTVGAFTRLEVGNLVSARQSFSPIAQLAYYNSRLANADLLALTA